MSHDVDSMARAVRDLVRELRDSLPRIISAYERSVNRPRVVINLDVAGGDLADRLEDIEEILKPYETPYTIRKFSDRLSD